MRKLKWGEGIGTDINFAHTGDYLAFVSNYSYLWVSAHDFDQQGEQSHALTNIKTEVSGLTCC